MIETSAHLIDHVIPPVPTRQWGLSFPWQLERDGVLIPDAEQPFLDLAPTDLQDTFNAASVRYRIAIGSNTGPGQPDPLPWPSRTKLKVSQTRGADRLEAAKEKTNTRRKSLTAIGNPRYAPRPAFLGRTPCDVPLKRVFQIDIERCPRCGGRLRVIAAVTQPDIIEKILKHVQQQQAPPRRPPGKAMGTSEFNFDVA